MAQDERRLRKPRNSLIPITTFAGKKVALFGLGGSGLASASALLAGGAHVVGWDDNADAIAKAASAGVPTGDLRHLDWSRISALVLAPGVPLTHPAPHWPVGLARAAAVEVIGDIELFCRERRRQAPQAPFVAITGTNGKSTTTALVAHLLHCGGHETQVGGNIGTAILSLEPPRIGRAHVIEVSSYQIDLAPTLDPSIGILINISGSSSLTLHEVHEASSVIQKAAHENANIIFGAVQDDAMKDTIKITVIAAGFKDANKKNIHQKPSFLAKTWKAAPEVQEVKITQQVQEEAPPPAPPAPVVHHAQVQQPAREVHQDVDDLDVPTFLRRQAQKA